MVPYLSNIEVFRPGAEFLTGRGANSTSQFGEDGLIEAALERFGATNRWCFEVGANDGLFFSNTHRLRCAGWDAVLIEADPELFRRLQEQAGSTVRIVHRKIGRDCLDEILFRSGAPADLDLGVIDIDGQDYHAWDGMQKFRPRLMLVEFDYGTDGPEGMSDVVPEIGGEGQASFDAILRLGKSKGYTALAKTMVNLLFVQTELL
jgi:hypothetical protein